MCLRYKMLFGHQCAVNDFNGRIIMNSTTSNTSGQRCDSHGQSIDASKVLPTWALVESGCDRNFESDDEKIDFAISLARRNVLNATGGPFGAAVFDSAGALIAFGVNRVRPLGLSIAHAEIIAISLAEQRLGKFRLRGESSEYTLATSGQPCCQCYGAIIWSGISNLLIAGRSEDALTYASLQATPLPADWVGELERRGVRVIADLHRGGACAVLAEYARVGGALY